MIERSFKEIKRNRQLYSDLPEHITKLLHRIDQGELNFHMDENELREMETEMSFSSDKQALALIITALLLSSPVFYFFDIYFLDVPLGIIMIIIAFILLVQLLVLMGKKGKYYKEA